MYGLIHTALKEMVLEHHGNPTWQRIEEISEVGSDSLLTMRGYDDEITMALVQASSAVLEVSVEDALHAFGTYWITEFAPREYGALLKHTGRSSFELLTNLDDLHDRISTVYTDFSPPSFRVKNIDSDSAEIIYVSSRKGLTPFVLGILGNLGSLFNEIITIESVTPLEVQRGEQTMIRVKSA